MTLNQNNFGFIRVASAVPALNVADIEFNVKNILLAIEQAANDGAQIIVFPELAVTGYTCADLFCNDTLLRQAEHALCDIAAASAEHRIISIVGAPLRCQGHLLNCAVVINDGHMWAVPKTYIPNYKEFYEKRWFTGAELVSHITETQVCGRTIPLGTDLIFDCGQAKFAVEICEDLWAPIPPSSLAAVNGANVIINLSASNELVGKHQRLVDLIRHQSRHCIAAYIYASAGYGESSTDLVFAGNAIIAENGNLLQEARRFSVKPQLVVADIDIDSLNNERRVTSSFSDSLLSYAADYEFIPCRLSELHITPYDLRRNIKKLPFVPTETSRLNSRCEEIVNIQTHGLMRRLQHTHCKSLVIGISGGLDSTLALMIAVRAFDSLGLDRKGIFGITMPGFGTSGRTHTNALALMQALGITVKEISIAPAVTQHFADIGQDPDNHDVTYENSQARERTQILMDYANKVGGMVLGTGDLSELALGWATDNGDHMSMYNVNGSIPKTLARQLVMWFASAPDTSSPQSLTIHETLLDVLHTPISPELTPTDENNNIKQKTEDIIGPYELHDFFLYNMLRHGFSPTKIFFLASHAFQDDFSPAEIKHWLTVFCRRFFSQQFKRSCLPDGPKVGSVSLSPRGDWRMPSDASAALWLKECENINV